MGIYRCAACGAVNRSERLDAASCGRCRSALDRSGAPQTVDAAALVALIFSSPAPVLVDFAAPGAACTCLDGLAHGCAGEVLCLRVDTVREPAAAAAYLVEGSPALVLFERGNEVARIASAAPSAELSRWVELSAHL